MLPDHDTLIKTLFITIPLYSYRFIVTIAMFGITICYKNVGF